MSQKISGLNQWIKRWNRSTNVIEVTVEIVEMKNWNEEEALPSGSNVEEGEDAMEVWDQGVGTVGKRITKSGAFGLNRCRVGIFVWLQ